MSEISKAFEKFVAMRCEELIQTDNLHKEMNQSILILEEQLIGRLNSDQLEIFQEYENEIIKQKQYTENLLYRQGFIDRIHIK